MEAMYLHEELSSGFSPSKVRFIATPATKTIIPPQIIFVSSCLLNDTRIAMRLTTPNNPIVATIDPACARYIPNRVSANSIPNVSKHAIGPLVEALRIMHAIKQAV
eukprot:CAMPEP_0197237144 /NCGR_PEP_ID=MMETSP1429-20130617/4055_1 /TAXON_ID=49237 /ORGANISM="Chaetoceros  sp., Strain UNC1202" /LENGTH=105 /DNA_ID=CAMNT_0042696083 /DNA_START=321 /DNA_END=638 /DNA_ORIENTATION=+